MLPRELGKDEVVYYPTQESSNLDGIKIADGQHLIESKYDKVYSQRTHQEEIYKFVSDSVFDVTRGFNATIFAYG